MFIRMQSFNAWTESLDLIDLEFFIFSIRSLASGSVYVNFRLVKAWSIWPCFRSQNGDSFVNTVRKKNNWIKANRP